MTILMHEPTEELFLGVIHPDAALFADYFNVDQASREHRNYRKALTEAGARVLTVREVLLDGTLDGEGNAVEGPALDALRTFAGEFLVYNTDAIPAQRDAQRAYKEEVLRRAKNEITKDAYWKLQSSLNSLSSDELSKKLFQSEIIELFSRDVYKRQEQEQTGETYYSVLFHSV